jgi:hypothetical protein
MLEKVEKKEFLEPTINKLSFFLCRFTILKKNER